MKQEPALAIGGTLSAILFALVAILKSAGVEVTDEMTDGINALILALCAIPAIGGLVTRFFVYAPATTERLVDEAYTAGVPPTEPKPDLPDPPGTA